MPVDVGERLARIQSTLQKSIVIFPAKSQLPARLENSAACWIATNADPKFGRSKDDRATSAFIKLNLEQQVWSCV